MTKINKLTSLFDEQAWNSDSFLAGSSLYKVNSSFVSSGTIDGSLDHDYYVIDGFLTTGSTYEIHLTSDSTNHGWSSNNESTFLEFDLYDYDDNLLGSSTLDFSRSLYDDVLEFTVPSDYKSWQPYYIDVHGLVFDATDYAITFDIVLDTITTNSSATFSDATLTSGDHYPGKVLSASISIADDDGTANATKTYTWFRYDGSSYAEITSGSSDTYTIQNADIGYAIYYQVSFTDDAGNSESSAYYGHGTSVATLNNAATFSDATLTSGDHYPGKVLSASISIADDDGTANATKTYTWFRYDGSSYAEITSGSSDTYTIQNADIGYAIYYQVSFTDDAGNSESSAYYGHGTSVATLNNAATFSDATLTSGDHYPGKVLSASISIADDDGTANATKTYTWFRYDGSSYAEITSGSSDTYTIQNADIGYAIYYQVSFTDDAGNSESSSYLGLGTTVAALNSSPSLSTTTSLTIDEDTASAAIAFSGSDIDGDTLTYTFSNPAKGSVANNGDGTFTYTPDANANGSDDFTITVNDGTVDVTETINVTINEVNDAPTVSSTAAISISEDSAYSYTFSVSDVDGDALTLNAETLPSWLSFDASSGILSGTPTNDDVGEHDVSLRVNDGTVDVDQSFKVTVSNTNDDPTVSSNAVTLIDEDSAYSYTFTASDIDVGDALTLSAETLPSWLSFDPAIGVLSGTPVNDDVGDHSVVLRATDATGAYAEQSFTVTVNNTNDAPTITTTTSLTTDEGIALENIAFSSSDVDAGDTLTYTFSNPAKGSVANNGDGTFTYTPDANANGSDDFTITVNDGTVDVTETINVTINEVNDAPTVSSTAAISISEDSAYSYTFSVSDVDGDALTLNAETLPSWLSFDASSGILSGTPTNDDVGEHDVSLRVNDGTVDVDQSFKVTVSNTNDDPTVSSNAVTLIDEDSAYSYTFTASDIDVGDALTLSAETLPSWLSFDPAIGVLSGTPVNDDVGDHSVVLRATDATGAYAEQSFTVTVNNTNDAPTITTTTSLTTDEGIALENIAFSSSDVDAGDTLTYTFSNPAKGSVANNGDGTFTYTPDANANGSDDFTITVNDGTVDVTETISLYISPNNAAPTGQIGLRGIPTVGHSLTLDLSLLHDDDGVGQIISYHWLRDGLFLNDANATPGSYFTNDQNNTSYLLTTDDIGSILSVQIEYINGKGKTETKLSLLSPEITEASSFNEIVAFDTNGATSYGPEVHELIDGNLFVSWTASDHADGSYTGAYITILDDSESSVTANEFSASQSGRQYSGPSERLNDGSILATWYGETTLNSGPTAFHVAKFSNLSKPDDLDTPLDQYTSFKTNLHTLIDLDTDTYGNVHMLYGYNGYLMLDTLDEQLHLLTDQLELEPQSFNGGQAVLLDDKYVYTGYIYDRSNSEYKVVGKIYEVDETGLNAVPTASFETSNQKIGDSAYSLQTFETWNGNIGVLWRETHNNTNGLPYFQEFDPNTGLSTGDAIQLTDGDAHKWAHEAIITQFSNNKYILASTYFIRELVMDDTGHLQEEYNSYIYLKYFDHNFQPLTENTLHGKGSSLNFTKDSKGNIFLSYSLDGDIIVTKLANNAPTNTTPDYIEVFEDTQNNTFNFSSFDIEGDTLTHSFSNIQNGTISLQNEDKFSYTPNANYSGLEYGTLAVTDGFHTTTKNFVINVINTNDAPTLTTTTSLTTNEDTALTDIAFSGSDVDVGDTLTYTFSDPAKGSVVDNDDGTFTYTPDANVNGSDSFTITVNDGTVDVVETVNVTINAVNDAPTLSTTTSNSGDALIRYTVPVMSYDVESEGFEPVKFIGMDTIVISFSGEPSFYYLYENENGFVEAGSPQIAIYDYDYNVTVSFLGNEIPLFDPNFHQSQEQARYYIDLGITRNLISDGSMIDVLWSHVDIDNGNLESDYLGSFAWYLNHDLEINNQAELTEFASLITETIAIPSDVPYGPNETGWLLSALTASGIEPDYVQSDSEPQNAPLTSIDEDSAYSYTFTASDIDVGDTLTLSAETLPSWLSFDAATGVLSGTPINDDVGDHSVVLRATDAAGAYQEQSFTITVNNTNDAPTLTTTTSLTTNEDTALTDIAFSGSDVDVGDTLTYTFSDPAKGSVANNNDGTFTYTPNANVNGSDSFTITVNDGTVDVTETINVTVNAVNDAPTASAILPSYVVGERFEYYSSAYDLDFDDTLYISILDKPDWLNVTEYGLISGVPLTEHIGSHSLDVKVSDGYLDTYYTFSFEVLPETQEHNLLIEAFAQNHTDESATVSLYLSPEYFGDTYSLQTFDLSLMNTDMEIIDARFNEIFDGGGWEFAAEGLMFEEGVTFLSGASSWSGPKIFDTFEAILEFDIYSEAGFTSDLLTVNDLSINSNTVHNAVPIFIDNLNTIAVNSAPVVNVENSLKTIEDLATEKLTIEMSDPDGDELSYSLSAPANGSIIDYGHGVLSYTPNLNFSGLDEFSVTVSDGQLETVQVIQVEIEQVNDLPTGELKISGDNTEGKSLQMLTDEIEDDDGLGVLNFTWMRNGDTIEQAKGQTYTLTELDVGAHITAEVEYVDDNGTLETLSAQLHQLVYPRENPNPETIVGTSGSDTLFAGQGADVVRAGAGNDTVYLSSFDSYSWYHFAKNVATGASIKIQDKTNYSSVIDGNSDSDTLVLMDEENGDAFFLHDAFTPINRDVSTQADHLGMQTAARVISVETILAGDGDDIIDLTSDTFDLGGTNITLRGEAGDDVLWAAEGNDTLDGGIGDDTLFGGDGNDILTGGDGADTFEFVNSAAAQTDTITDYTSDDTLKFYLGDGDSQITQADYKNGILTWGNLTITLDNSLAWDDLSIVYA